jgi:hypothetical protein
LKNYDTSTQLERDLHMGKVMWVTNKALGSEIFDTDYIRMINRYMKKHPDVTIAQLLESDDYRQIQ